MTKKFSKGTFSQLYQETVGIDLTNKKIKLKESDNKEENPFPGITELRLRLLSSEGKISATSVNTNVFVDMKVIFVLFDLTDKESFNAVSNYITISKNFFGICQKKELNKEEELIKQPKKFKDIPILIIGNKLDLDKDRKVSKEEIQELIKKLQNENNFTKLTYHEISVKEGIGIEKIFQEAIFYYLKRNFEPIVYKLKNQGGPNSPEASEKDLIKINNNNNINDEKDEKDIIAIEKKDENEKNEKSRNKRTTMDKSVVIFHQILDKMKKQFYNEIISLKEENKKEMEQFKKNFENQKNMLNEKIDTIENKNKELENQIKLKTKEIEDLKELFNKNPLNKDIILKFKIPDNKFIKELIINTKEEKRMSEVISTLYELCPYLNNLKIKYFSLHEKENKKIDEMKTVSENKLTNGSTIYLIV